MDIYELVNKYIEAGYSEEDAIPKVAQDIILLKIGNSKYHKNITVKGGVVMHNISKDMRRATRDMDIDFIKYSLEDKSIRNFIKELNNTDDGIKIKITGKIEPLHHQDYDGKRVYITLTDKNHYSIMVDLPGYNKDDIKISIEDGYLTISATMNKNEEEKEHGKFVRRERYFGECSRSFYVGEEVKEDDIKASFKNGTLKIEVPKKEEKKELPEKKYIQIDD